MSVRANCPSCGGQVEFRVDTSFVTICEFCSSAVARSDRGLEDCGKVVDLIDSASPLELFLEGRYGEARFTIVGRTQLRHGMGGVWDEWYCAFDSGHWGWLAEAQGKFYMSFATPAEALPAYGSLSPGAPVASAGEGMLVAELGEAQILGAKGEIPYLLDPGARYHYADLSGPNSAFATIDYSEGSPELYLGKEVTLADLGISVQAGGSEEFNPQAGTKVSARSLECPNCRGALELVAPNETERVACPYCGALSDVGAGSLQILQILDKSKFPDPPLPLGSAGKIDGDDYQVCGYVVRSICYDGEMYYWDEYLLYCPSKGFRWLIDSDGHWQFIEPLAVADVARGYQHAKHDGKIYKLFDNSSAQVEFVLGQFYWKVEVGERVQVSDYINPPHTLSAEETAKELQWSKGTHIERAALEKAFQCELRPATNGTVGLSEPYPHKGVYKLFLVLAAAAVALFLFMSTRNRGAEVLAKQFAFEPTEVNLSGASSRSKSQVQFSEPFELSGGKNIEFAVSANINNAWMWFQFDLINETTGLVSTFDIPIEYYSGPGWTEGSRVGRKVLQAMPAGTYTLRVASERQRWNQPASPMVVVREGVSRPRYLLILFGLLFTIPFFTFLHHRSFEQKRWSDASTVGPWWARTSESE